MPPQRAILLVRISDDREGEGLGVGRQEEDGRKLADRIDWGIAEVIIENDTSAFKRRRVRLPDGTIALRTVRPGLRRSLDLLDSGERDGLMAYDLDRYTRDPRDLEDLIDIVEQKRIPVTSVTGSLRLDSDADITMARVMVAIANKSSRDTSRRVSRKHEELAKLGKPSGGGRRAFGYDPDGMTIREEEAAAIRKMAEIILGDADNSLYAVVTYLNENGPPPPYAAQWNTRSVGSILEGPRIAGLRRFRGEVTGEAAWPAILDREVWDAVQVRLKVRRLAPGGPNNALKRWLSGALPCGLCGKHLQGWGPRYWCVTSRGGCGRIAISAERVEEEVGRQIVEYLSNPGALAALRQAFSSDAVSDARAELAADEEQLKVLVGMWARRELSLDEYTEARAIITERLDANKILVASPLPGVVQRVLGSGDIAARWEELAPGDRRALVLAVVPGGYRVLPSPPGLKVFDPARLQPIL